MSASVRNAGYSYREQIGPMAAGRPVLNHLAERYPHSSRLEWQSRLAAGEVELEGRVCAAEARLTAGQWLVWHRPGWLEPLVPLHFEVIHEDPDLLVVAKPSGLPTVPAGGFLAHTLQALVQRRDADWAALHRLGRGTSGLVLFARTPLARAALQADLRGGGIDKRYLALVSGDAPRTPQTLATPIGEVAHPRLGTVHAASATGRAATTVIERLWERAPVRPDPSDSASPATDGSESEAFGKGWLTELRLLTGRPHQIRIHLAAVGHPLVGDPLYVEGGGPRPDLPGLPGDLGYHLHAWRLVLRHPVTGALAAFEAPPPPSLSPLAPR